jgi:hypothetical protein
MATKRCEFFNDDGSKVAEHEGSGPNEAVARRAAISKYDWEEDHSDVTVDCR